MSYFVKPDGSYYEGDREHAIDVAVTARPSLYHNWNGTQWVIDQVAQDAETARTARHAALDTSADTDPLIDQLRAATPAQITTYINANVTDLASARVVLAKLAVGLAFALRGGRDK